MGKLQRPPSNKPFKHKPAAKSSSSQKPSESSIKFVTLNTTNINILKESFDSIAQGLYTHLADSGKYFLYQKMGKVYEIYLVPVRIHNIVKNLRKSFDLFHVAISLGTMQRRRTRTGFERAFFLSYEGGRFLYEIIQKELPQMFHYIHKVILDAEGEQKFLYGRDVEMECVLSDTSDLVKKEIIFVLNEEDQYLGLALLRVKQAGASKPEDGIRKIDAYSRSSNFSLSIMNLIDAGYYLRGGS